MASACLLPIVGASAQPADIAADAAPSAAAAQIADIFSQVGDQIYEECIFELSPEQLEVQHALITAYIQQGATSTLARQLAVKQIQPPKLSPGCEQVRQQPPEPIAPSPWETTLEAEVTPEKVEPPVPKAAEPKLAARPQPNAKPAAKSPKTGEPSRAETPASEKVLTSLKDRKMLEQWDCAANVDYVTISLNGFKRKLTGGEICNPYQDVVREVPATGSSFRLGYTIRTGRLFVVSDDPKIDGRTIAWALSGRDVCRNNPDPECLAARAVGPLPPGEYTFASDKAHRVSWGPKTKRNVAGIWLRKLWNQDRYTPQQKKAILARGNIAIHMRLKGEMSEACIGMEPKGWAYVASLIKEGRATGVNVYVDEPHPQIAEAPPIVEGSSFSLTSLFK
ncbi:MAG TPA: tlde1 domain-containing protein [Hyphomicrobium sp.]|nr:tlde1 domain-containing protein [Hyphomicrobium sp.]